MRNITRSITT